MNTNTNNTNRKTVKAYNDDDRYTEIDKDTLKKINKLASAYSCRLQPKLFTIFYDKLMQEFGVEVGLISGRGNKGKDGTEKWVVDYTLHGKTVTNSRFVYSVYKDGYEKDGKYEFNVYFS